MYGLSCLFTMPHLGKNFLCFYFKQKFPCCKLILTFRPGRKTVDFLGKLSREAETGIRLDKEESTRLQI